jgi:beta-galactosidase
MKKRAILQLLVLLLLVWNCSKPEPVSRIQSFDEGWKFLKENPSGAEMPDFDDARWLTVYLPHDWSIEDLPDQDGDSIIGPFSKAAIGKMGTGYTIGGTAWYRKKFTLDATSAQKTAYLIFDGIYMNSDVWVNGKPVGSHPYGYTSIYYDITPYLNPAGQSNTVAVQVKNEGRTARWYSGSGIYRHTWLMLVNPVHIAVWGVFIKTPEVSDQTASVELETSLLNKGKENAEATVTVDILDPSGKVVGNGESTVTLAPGKQIPVQQKVTVANPALWSVESPQLYTARVSVRAGKTAFDATETRFGIRTIKIDAENGLTINGKPLELIGGCFHHDNGPLGAAAIDRAEERKIELFKNAGYNAIRCSHNPPSPALLDACDRLGILVIDEIFDNWEREKVSADDYSKSFKDWWKKDLELL